MRDVATTLYSFWSSFGIPAYPEYNIPDDAEMPYTSMHARVWYRDTSYVSISTMLDMISNRIGDGLSLRFGNGFMTLFKDSQFIQFQPYEVDNEVKVAYLSLIQNVYK